LAVPFRRKARRQEVRLIVRGLMSCQAPSAWFF